MKMKNPQLFLFLALIVLIGLNLGLLLGLVVKLSLHTKCPKNSRPDESVGERIVGGIFTKIEFYTYVVALVAKVNGNTTFQCGGVIISRRWLLTAAHCEVTLDVLDMDGKPIYAMGGVTEWRRGYYHRIIYHVKHEDYCKDVDLSNDIALIKVKEPFHKRYEISIAVASNKYVYQVGKDANVTGWGVERFGNPEPASTLKVAMVTLLDVEYCKHLYLIAEMETDQERGFYAVDDTMFCAGHLVNGSDACQGDSGGPLADGRLLIGLVSWALKCGVDRYPGIYTKLGRYQDWIQSIGNKLGEKIGIVFLDSPS